MGVERDSDRPPPDDIRPGTLLAGRYEIRCVLGEGATAITWLAYDTLAEELFVLKRIRNPEWYHYLSRHEFKQLLRLSHPNLRRVYEILEPTEPFHLKMEYIAGTTLKELSDCGNPKELCLRVARHVLSALDYLESQGLIHRDISPANIIIPEDEGDPVRLIDFGLASCDGDRPSLVGTPAYRAPETERGEPWTHRCDIYSLAAVLFEMLTGRLPYVTDSDLLRKDQPVRPTMEEERSFGREFLRVLLKAAAPNPADRHTSAEAFRKALDQAVAADNAPAAENGREEINPTVVDLRQVYRNSTLGNNNNRGLESSFNQETYVKTKLDTELMPQILAGRHRLVILSGNPGDGKTAFLQRLRQELMQRRAVVLTDGDAGWRLRLGNRDYAALYDASEADRDQSADALFHNLLEPLAGRRPPQADYVAAVAANDGRLQDFFERYGATFYGWIWNRLEPQMRGEDVEDDEVLLIDMKRRFLAAQDASQPSLFTGILDRFLDKERWRQCDSCGSRHGCPIWFNVHTLSDPRVGPLVRERLHRLLLTVHLRRERRATVRDLRSALAFILTHDMDCRDVHDAIKGGRWPLADSSVYYFNAAFDGSGGEDLLLDEWRELDPSLTPTPRLDRFLYFHRNPDQIGLIETLFVPVSDRSAPDFVGETPSSRISNLKRRYFFEGDASHAATDKRPSPSRLLPYRYLDDFIDILIGRTPPEAKRDFLLSGISRADGVPQWNQPRLALRATEASGHELVVVKTFPAEAFRLRVPTPRRQFVEVFPDHLILEHVGGFPSLTIGLDLFEYLCRANDGLTAGAEEQRALAEDLAIFKNQLLAYPADEVLVIEPNVRCHRVVIENGCIIREDTRL